MLSEIIDHVRWPTVSQKMLYGVFYGYSVAEMLWAKDGATIFPDQIKVRNRRRFVFGPDFRPRLLTHESPQGEELPENKFWLFSTGADNDDEPYGRGLAHWLFWPVFFKKHQTQFWLRALEKFGSPTVVGKYRRGAGKEERDALLKAIEDVRSRTGVIMPDDALLDLLEATRSGAMDFASFREAMDRAITMVNLSQTMTSDDGSSMSQAQVHMDVRREVVESDARLICDSFTRGPARWLTAWNLEGAETPVIRVAMDNEERLARKSERDERISDMGFRLSTRYIEDTYGVEVESAASMPGAGGEPDAADLAEGDESDPLLAALNAIDAEDWKAIASPAVQPLLARAKSDPEVLMADIAALYPELDTTAIEAQLTQIIFVADTWERLAAQRENA